ncbi:MAG: hypothetical protein U0599_25050 [Vicinamibacteria bacterium]
MRTHEAALLAGAMALASAVEAAPSRDCSRNAALGYWMAMAEMQNPDAAASLSEQLERTARGDAPWDERLAPIVEANRDALATMQRASSQPFCDWGLEHSRNAEAPIAHLVRARALARLNVLQGLRLLHRGDAAGAVAAWSSGVRFSRDIAAGSPLIGALYASEQLRAHMRAIEGARDRLPERQRREIEDLVASLPEDGFDWGASIDVELGGALGLQQRLVASDDPLGELRAFVGAGKSPAEQDRAVAAYLGLAAERLTDRAAVKQALARGLTATKALRPRMVASFRLPYPRSVTAVREVVAEAKSDPTLAQGWPSLARANEEARAGLVAARASLLAALVGGERAPAASRDRSLRDTAVSGPALATILDRASEYVSRYRATLSRVQAEETYRLWAMTAGTTANGDRGGPDGNWTASNPSQALFTTELRSELVWVTSPNGASWRVFRDVVAWNGKPRPRNVGRLASLFANPGPTADEQARRILRESAELVAGPRRDVNLPTLALLLLLRDNQRRFEFTREGERAVGEVKGVDVAFRESARPTLVRDGSQDVPSEGRFCIDPANGAILRTDILYASRGSVTTLYRRQPGFDVLVPDEMREAPGARALDERTWGVANRARYGEYRRF